MKRELLIVRVNAPWGYPGGPRELTAWTSNRKASCQTPTLALSQVVRVVGLERSGKGRNQGESRQSSLGILLLAGGIREGVVGKSQGWCSYESCVSFVPFSFHTSPDCLNRWKIGNIMTYRQRERWAKSKCILTCSLFAFGVGFLRKEPRQLWGIRGTHCMF